MKLTVVVENFADTPNVIAEYGLSMHIQDDRTQVLMDTGQGEALIPNMYALGIRPDKVDHLVLSHGHFDHTGGMQKFLLRSGNIPIWAHPDVEIAHTRARGGMNRFIGCHLNKDAFDFRPVTGLTEISDGIWAVEVPVDHRDPAFLSSTGHLVLPSGKEWVPDTFPDDISLVVKGDRGLSVVFGCAHAGTVNILEEVSLHFGTREFYSVIGGMHLGGSPAEFVEMVTGELVSRFSVAWWKPCHCSGIATAISLSRRSANVSWAGAGTSHEI